MSFDLRRRQEGTRKRGYFDSAPETSSIADSTADNNNSSSLINNQEKYTSSKAYAVHDSSLEDLDRLIMFITESKQIQGRYYVRYLPGMMNSSGELTPCNYRPTFSFSPPRSPASTTTTTTTTSSSPSSSRNNIYNNNNNRTSTTKNTSLANNRSIIPDVVDLTKEDDTVPSAGSKARAERPRPNSFSTNDDSEKNEGKKRGNETAYSDDGDDDDDVGKSGLARSSYSSSRTQPSCSTPTNNRKQTARKSMRSQSEVRPNEIPELKSLKSDSGEIDGDDNDDAEDQGTRHLNTTGETSFSSDEGSVGSERRNKSLTNANNNTISSSRSNVVNNINNSRGLSEKWNLMDGITVTVNPDFG